MPPIQLRYSGVRRAAAAAIILVFVFGPTPACAPVRSTTAAPQVAAGQPEAKAGQDLLHFTMLYTNEVYAPYNPDWPFLNEIQKRTGVQLDLVIVPTSDFDERLGVLVNSGEMPDILTRLWPSSFANLCVGGSIFLPVSDHLDLLPNFTRMMKEWGFQQEYDSYVLADGKFYWLPGLNEKPVYNAGYIARTDLLEQYPGKVHTYDDLYSFLKWYKTGRPDSLPMTGCGLDCLLSFIGFGWGIQAGWNTPHGVYYDYEQSEFRMAMTSDKYRRMLTYLAKLMSEGLLDPEITTQDMETFKQKLADGTSVVTWYYIEPVTGVNNIGKQGASPGFNLALMPPIAGPAGAFTQNTESKFNSGWMMPARVAAESDFEELMGFADWLAYSEEGVTLMTWGVEGLTYEIREGKKVFTAKVLDSSEGISRTLQSKFGLNSISITSTRPADYMMAILDDDLKPVVYEVMNRRMDNPPIPVVQFTQEEKDRVELIKTALLPYCADMQQQFLYGKRSIETDWDGFVQAAGQMGTKELEDLFNNALKRSGGR